MLRKWHEKETRHILVLAECVRGFGIGSLYLQIPSENKQKKENVKDNLSVLTNKKMYGTGKGST